MEQMRLRDGMVIAIRPMTVDDAPLLRDIFNHLSAESRYRRFNVPTDSISAEMAQRVSQQMVHEAVDNGQGWLAFADDVAIGGIRYVLIDPFSAEMAITIRDDYQGRGLGKLLMHQLLTAAEADGLRTILATVQADNDAMRRLVETSPYPYDVDYDGGMTTMKIKLGQQVKRPLRVYADAMRTLGTNRFLVSPVIKRDSKR